MDVLSLILGKRLKDALVNAGSNLFALNPKIKSEEKFAKINATKTPETKQVNDAVGNSVKAKKKHFFMDADYLAVVLLLVIVLFGAKVYGFSISAPESIEITDKAVFDVNLTNNSDSVANISVNFFSPAKSEIKAPKQLAPNSTGKATITIYNNINKVEDISATIEVIVGAQIIQKQVTLSFKENQAGSISAAFTALFSFGLFNKEVANFNTLDWIFFWVLVIVAAVLIISFVSRIVRRS